jgi:myo-inositol-1(or 4)-monophosphatase
MTCTKSVAPVSPTAMTDLSHALSVAVAAAREAGGFLASHFGEPPEVNELQAHDIKLAIDVQTQDLITHRLLEAFPDHALYGEEGIAGNQDSEWQWIVDPLDGTVNYYYGLPHYCVSIALRRGEEIQLGVIYDPQREELWQTKLGAPTLLNGKAVKVSDRAELSEAVVSIGFSKSKATINAGLALLPKYVERVRKCRLMGSAALDLAYVATGRFDAYIEQSVSLWDVAAGKILLENAGGRFEMTQRADTPDKISVRAWNGKIELLPAE